MTDKTKTYKDATKTYNQTAMLKEVDGIDTVSGKIRKLNKSGYTRSQIADALNKRYQHVRNVLVEDARS